MALALQAMSQVWPDAVFCQTPTRAHTYFRGCSQTPVKSRARQGQFSQNDSFNGGPVGNVAMTHKRKLSMRRSHRRYLKICSLRVRVSRRHPSNIRYSTRLVYCARVIVQPPYKIGADLIIYRLRIAIMVTKYIVHTAPTPVRPRSRRSSQKS